MADETLLLLASEVRGKTLRILDAVAADATGNNGRPLNVSWTVSNRGIGLTNTPVWNDNVFISADPTGATSVPGVWVAGNVSDLSAQVVVSAAAGLRAGARINADLVDRKIRFVLVAPDAVPALTIPGNEPYLQSTASPANDPWSLFINESKWRPNPLIDDGDFGITTGYAAERFAPGPTTTPIGSGFRSVNVGLRQSLGLYANLRPARVWPGLENDGPLKPSVLAGTDLTSAAGGST